MRVAGWEVALVVEAVTVGRGGEGRRGSRGSEGAAGVGLHRESSMRQTSPASLWST